MNKLRKAMMALGVLLVTSIALVSCSDDEPSMMGPCSINSCVTTSNSVTLWWSVVPNAKCAGYEIVIYQGTRDNIGAEVARFVTDDNKVFNHTFENLAPATTYVASSRAIPAANSGFKDSDVAYLQFTTKSN